MSVELEIVSPTKLVLSRLVDMVVMPGFEGDLAAMEKHAPMITLLRGGVITLHEGGKPTDRFFVAGGFAEITPDRCTILADDVVPVGELSAQAMANTLADAERAWQDVDKFDVVARDAVLDRLQSARAGVQAAQT
jgi:F-type H+-transporting ATPase subunit epsilon